MKKITLLLFLVMLSALSACSSRNQPRAMFEAADTASNEVEAAASPSWEAVFVYGKVQLPPQLVLILGGEPILLPSGYVRLVGVVSGRKPIALIEMGGRGLALGKGENVDDYRVVGIDDDRVVLERRK